MVRFLATRVAMMVGVLFSVSVLTFLLVSLLPGDPALQVLGSQSASKEAIRQVRRQMGLDHPLLQRYFIWLDHALHGDLGTSIRTHQRVSDAILQALPVTAELILLSLIVALLIAIPLGVLAAYRANTWVDRLGSSASLGLLAMPPFVVGIALIYIFSVKLRWFPATGWWPLSSGLVENLQGAFLPSVALALGNIAVFMRLLRADMKATLQEDYILIARSKGMPARTILFRHALRPSSFSVLTILGIQIGALVGGAVVVETIFGLPGVGTLLVNSILQRDIVVVQGIVLVVAAIYVVANFLVDVAYTLLDPRIRNEVRGRAR